MKKAEPNWESMADYSPENEEEMRTVSLNNTVYEISEKDFEELRKLFKIKGKLAADNGETHEKACELIRKLGNPIIELDWMLRDDAA